MKWILIAAVVTTAVAVYVAIHHDAPTEERLPGATGPYEEGAAQEAAPKLAVRGTESPHPEAVEVLDSATRPSVAPEAPPAPQGEGAKETPPPTRALRPGETFTPFTALELPTKEEQEAAARKTREILMNAKPPRATWGDVPLQDVLRQLSEETGLVLALGPRALDRGMKIRVSDPLDDADPPVEPTVWNILEALARQHRFVLSPWKKGVLLREIRDPEEVQMCVYSLQDLVLAEWGNKKKEIDAEDRLTAVFADLVRDAAALPADSEVRMIGANMVARQTRAVHERIGKVLDMWRADPDRFQQAYRALIAKRHPTVSGAPPRTSPPDAAGAAGK